jgi:hypothetical protein
MENDWPSTLDEAVTQLIASLTEEEKDVFCKLRKSDVGHSCHFDLSLWVRNSFGFYQGNDALIEECAKLDGNCYTNRNGEKYFFTDPDDASAMIVMAAWKRLRSQQKITG